MATLEDFEAYVAIVEKGSMTKAARHLGRSLQAISRALNLVEQDVGVRLIHRTTRRLQPTFAGLAFHKRLKVALDDIQHARTEAALNSAEIAGSLRLGSSTFFAPSYVVPVVATFMELHPAVSVALVISDDFQDPVADNLDLIVRIGQLSDSGLIARRIMGLRRVAFAAPIYLSRHGYPMQPADLHDHLCVVRTASASPFRWNFRGEAGEEVVEVTARFTSNHAAACNEATARGLGVGLAPLWQIRNLVDSGRVELLLTDFEPSPAPVHLVWAPGAKLPARTRSLIDYLAATLPASIAQSE